MFWVFKNLISGFITPWPEQVPSDFISMVLIGCLETILPTATLLLILIFANSTSNLKVLNRCDFLRKTLIISASPLGLAVRYNTLLPCLDLVN